MKTDLTKIKEVYEKYENMEDSIMKWDGNMLVAGIMRDLWLAVKESMGHKVEVKKRR